MSMKLNIHYFGITSEITNCSQEIYSSEAQTFKELRQELIGRFPELENVNFQLAQNYEFVSLQDPITEIEIALLPPFSGG